MISEGIRRHISVIRNICLGHWQYCTNERIIFFVTSAMVHVILKSNNSDGGC